MDEIFVPFEIATKLKDIGFNKKCVTFYNKWEELNRSDDWSIGYTIDDLVKYHKYPTNCLAPTWEQAINWLRTEKNIYIELGANFSAKNWEFLIAKLWEKGTGSYYHGYSYEEARKQSILKAIELITK